jgi:hypothetical protein
MKFVLQRWHLLLLILAGWINRQQQDAWSGWSSSERDRCKTP